MNVAKRIEEMLVSTVNVESSVVEKAVAKHNVAKAERLTEQIASVVASGESLIDGHVAELRLLRKREKAMREKLANADRALRYFKATGNPLPLSLVGVYMYEFLAVIGADSIESTDPQWKIPDDFE